MSEKALTVIDKPQDLALFQQGYVQEYGYNVGIKQFADGEIVHCFIAWWR